MPIINVNLIIVGLYFSQKVSLQDKKGLTVKEVMDAYRATTPITQPFGLDYRAQLVPGSNYQSILSLSHMIPEGQISKRSKRPLPPGLYTIQEVPPGFNPRTIWQYYVLDPQGKVDGATKSVTFDNPNNDYNLADGSTIIWRAVSILFFSNDSLSGPNAVV